ncbi:MAG: polysaccharide deacetylase family protein [Chthoniobacterales bacterium]
MNGSEAAPAINGKRFLTITFDDGLIEGARKAVDILGESGARATFYVVTGWVRPREVPLTRDRWNRGLDHGSWRDWREIMQLGHEIGSHTVTHLNAGGRLARWIPGMLRWELAHSHARLRRRLGIAPTSISMPWNTPTLTYEYVVRRLYRACRIGSPAPRANNLSRVDWYSLHSWAPDSDASVPEIVEQVNATPPGHWLILQFHGFDGEGYMPVDSGNFREVSREIAQLDNLEHVTVAEMVRRFRDSAGPPGAKRVPSLRRKARICLVTSEHLFMNPRLVKEADALHAAGYNVNVVSCQWQEWQRREDKRLVEMRGWRNHVVDFSRERQPGLFWFSRLRHYGARKLAASLRRSDFLKQRAIGRVAPEIARIAASVSTDLFIGHNIAALPAVVLAARARGVRAGFDAEDFHSRMWLKKSGPTKIDRLTEEIERRFLPQCCYVTAAAPLIAEAYWRRCAVPLPSTILNVFPLGDRPARFREHDPAAPLTLYWFSQVIGATRGLEEIVRALGLTGNRNIQLHLRGQWQPGYRAMLYALAAKCGLQPGQLVSHELASPDDMIRLSAAYDVGLALEPGRSQNNSIALSNKIFTYLVAGNAVIATATRGQRLLMQELPEAGLCYEIGDIAVVARQLGEWERDRSALERVRRNAWRYGEEKYNWEIEQEKFLTIVEEALTGHAVVA